MGGVSGDEACGSDKVGHPSQRNGIRRDAVPDIPVQSSLGHHVDLAAEQVFLVLSKSNVVEETPPRLELDEEVEVALRGLLVPGHRPKDPDPAGAVSGCDSRDLFPPLKQVGKEAQSSPLLYRSYGPGDIRVLLRVW